MNSTFNRPLVYWLLSVCGLVFFMVIVGGITRLTDSGLSMVDWRPLMGAIPPLSEQAWLEVFEQYQQYPEYQKINKGMTLSEFKFIFFWEYFHRLTGRLIGLVFFVPYVFFLVKGKLDSSLKWKLFIAFILGGMQGLMGWYMVKSGLVDRPDVSHYRLAAHLSLAFIIIGYIFWIIFDLIKPVVELPYFKKTYFFLMGFAGLLGIQIVYGAFVAGLDAGIGYNTFPTMNGQWVPKSFFFLNPSWLNFFENNASVQFIHRTLGWIIFFSAGHLFFSTRKKELAFVQRRALNMMLVMIILQFLLGVLTLVFVVPLSLASLHQAGACLLLILTLRAINLFAPQKSK
jgi:cytochrome c oxidase assembly protein subunit 15